MGWRWGFSTCFSVLHEGSSMGNVYCTDWVDFDLNKGGLQPYLSSSWWDDLWPEAEAEAAESDVRGKQKNCCILVANQPHPFPLLLCRISSRLHGGGGLPPIDSCDWKNGRDLAARVPGPSSRDDAGTVCLRVAPRRVPAPISPSWCLDAWAVTFQLV